MQFSKAKTKIVMFLKLGFEKFLNGNLNLSANPNKTSER